MVKIEFQHEYVTKGVSVRQLISFDLLVFINFKSLIFFSNIRCNSVHYSL